MEKAKAQISGYLGPRPAGPVARNQEQHNLSSNAAAAFDATETGDIKLSKSLREFKFMSFDVVGTLIDFEGGLTSCLNEIAAEAGVTIDGEEALNLYRAARYSEDAGLFPDDLVRVYNAIAPILSLPVDASCGERLRDSAKTWKAFPDSAEAMARLARDYRLIAMTNARHWAFEYFSAALGDPFHAAFTVDDTGTEKPDPAFFQQVFDFVADEGANKNDILHVAQSQYHDIGVSRELGMTNCWIERRHAVKGYGGTIEPAEFTKPDYHFTSMVGLANAATAARS